MGPRGLRRGAQNVGFVLRRGDQLHETPQTGSVAIRNHAAFSADDRHAAQRKGRGLPAFHGTPRRGPVRGAFPRRGAQGGRFRPDAAHGQGKAPEDGRYAPVPGTYRPYSTRLPSRGLPAPRLHGPAPSHEPEAAGALRPSGPRSRAASPLPRSPYGRFFR